MSRAIEILENEHRVIEQVLDAMQDWADALENGTGGDGREALASFVIFLRGFADRCHHGKEEEILFREMTARGFPVEEGPLAVMSMEHEQGRSLVRMMDQLAHAAAPWSQDDRLSAADAVHSFSALLRQHIVKEDSILYPMAVQHLGAEVMAELEAAFERFEHDATGEGEHERLHNLAEELVRAHSSGKRRPSPVLPCHGCMSPGMGCGG